MKAIGFLRSPASWVFVEQFIQADIKESSKVLITGPLCGESTGHRWIPLTKGQ